MQIPGFIYVPEKGRGPRWREAIVRLFTTFSWGLVPAVDPRRPAVTTSARLPARHRSILHPSQGDADLPASRAGHISTPRARVEENGFFWGRIRVCRWSKDEVRGSDQSAGRDRKMQHSTGEVDRRLGTVAHVWTNKHCETKLTGPRQHPTAPKRLIHNAPTRNGHGVGHKGDVYVVDSGNVAHSANPFCECGNSKY